MPIKEKLKKAVASGLISAMLLNPFAEAKAKIYHEKPRIERVAEKEETRQLTIKELYQKIYSKEEVENAIKIISELSKENKWKKPLRTKRDALKYIETLTKILYDKGFYFVEEVPNFIEALNNKHLDCDTSYIIFRLIGGKNSERIKPLITTGHLFLKIESDRGPLYISYPNGIVLSQKEIQLINPKESDLKAVLLLGIFAKTLNYNKNMFPEIKKILIENGFGAHIFYNEAMDYLNIDKKKAKEYLIKAIKDYPNHYISYYRLGILEDNLQRKAVYFKKYLENLILNNEIFHRPYNYHLYDLAINELAKHPEIKLNIPSLGMKYYILGKIAKIRGEKTKARRYLKKALRYAKAVNISIVSEELKK